ncbi:MAG: dihydroorotase [Cyclobacteriaceae bacterium]
MKMVFANATINDIGSKYHGKKCAVEVEAGIITEISKSLDGHKVVDLEGQILTPSLFDLFSHYNEPGTEYREDLASGCRTAAFGGFSDVCVIPNTSPVIESKSSVKFVKSRSTNGVNLHVIAALSEQCNGENITEILDLNEAGALAFSDGLKPVWNTELLLKALQYVSKFSGLIINRAKDIHLSQYAQMHEGVTSTMLGLKGEPSISEELSIKRDLDVLRYAGGRLHFTHLSTANGVSLIRSAKKEGLQVTCDVALPQLLFNDSHVEEYDCNYKVDPPLRGEKDRKALIRGLKDGTIDAIVSSHQPLDPESKELEFDLASCGMNLQPIVFGALLSLEPELPLEVSLNKFGAGARSIVRMEHRTIEVGNAAQFAIFDPKRRWTLNNATNPSKSRNSPFFNKEIQGFCSGIFDGKKLHRNEI